MMPFLNWFSWILSFFIVLCFYPFEISNKVVKGIVMITIKFFFKFFKLLFSLFLVDLYPFLIIFLCKLSKILINPSLQLLYQIRMTLFRVHSSFLELCVNFLSDFLLLFLHIFLFNWILHQFINFVLQHFGSHIHCF